MAGAPWAPSSVRSDRGADRITDLLLRQGDISAQRQAQSGQVWGNALAGVGQAVGGAIQQHAEQKEQTKRGKAFEAAVASGDPNLILRVLGPRDGPPVIQALKASTPDGMKQYADRMMLARDIARGALSVPPENRAQAIEFGKSSLLNAGVFKPEELPEVIDEPFLRQLSAYGQEAAKQDDTAVVGGALVNKRTGEPIYTAPEKPPGPETRSLDVQAAEALARGDQATYQRLLKVKKEMGQADDRPRITVNAGGSGMSPTMEANVINRLTTQYAKAVAPSIELTRQVKLMDAGLEAARKGDMAQGSQVVLVTFQKILDPPSVVRESEYNRSPAGLAMEQRIKGAYQKLLQGGAGVPIGELEKFAELARTAAKAQASGYLDAVKDRIGQNADRFKIPRDLIMEDFDFNAATDAPTPAAPAGGAQEITATGPDGKKLVLRNGQWVPVQ